MDWAEQYRPLHVQEIVGNGPAIRQMVEWARNWSQKSKPLILYGKPGTGKTSSAYALAHDMGWDVVELNASDERTRAAIDRIAGSSAVTASLSGASRKLIVLDEADHLHGTADRGGAKAIIDIIKQTRQPIILIANDIYALPQELKARGELVQFRALQARSILPRLKYIAAAEGVTCSDAALVDIAASADGDMRAAINMLYAAAIGKAAVGECDVFSTKKDERSSIFDLISSVFAGRREEDLITQSSEVNDTPDAIEQWIEANVHYLPDPDSLAEGYRYLSRADEYIGLTYRRQYYILWRYANALMLLGVAHAARGRGLRARILPPPRWKRMSASRKQKTIRNNLFKKLAEEMHIQQSTLRETYLTPLAMMVERDPETFTAEFELDEDELGLLINDRSRAAEIVKELAKRAKAEEKQRTAPKQKEEKKVNAGNQSSLPGF